MQHKPIEKNHDNVSGVEIYFPAAPHPLTRRAHFVRAMCNTKRVQFEHTHSTGDLPGTRVPIPICILSASCTCQTYGLERRETDDELHTQAPRCTNSHTHAHHCRIDEDIWWMCRSNLMSASSEWTRINLGIWLCVCAVWCTWRVLCV